MSSNRSPSPSPSSSSGHASLNITPSRKVQALLAQFSDSETEGEQARALVPVGHNLHSLAESRNRGTTDEDDEDEDDEELRPRGRLAARLLGERPALHPLHDTENDAGFEKTGEDDTAIKTAVPSHPQQSAEGLDKVVSPRSPSPLFFPSPTNNRRASVSPQTPRSQVTPTNSTHRDNADDRSRFLALVDKHRKQRINREAAEIIERAVGVTKDGQSKSRRARGSSPADDSSEGDVSSNNEAVKRIQKEARPTRKASKKALEEMNRETQRMSRNMQLAHQARTKKRITKESFLSRFSSENIAFATKPQSSTASSSVTASDVEELPNQSDTPPTSPLKEIGDETQKSTKPEVKDLTDLLQTGDVIAEMRGGLAPEDDISIFLDSAVPQSFAERANKLHDYCRNNVTVRSPNASTAFTHQIPVEPSRTTVPTLSSNKPLRVNLARSVVTQQTGSDSEGEIEIVKDRGSKRKYAAFETLPKRKAKEMPSHLALRSLAHIVGNEDKKRSMNAVELQTSLRRKARLQALEERKQKIEMLKAKGIVVQSAEERERDQQEVEDLVERARQEAATIQKREKELAKKDGTYVKDTLDDEDDDSEDEDFEEEAENPHSSESEDEENELGSSNETNLIDGEVEEAASGEESEPDEESAAEESHIMLEPAMSLSGNQRPRLTRNARVISDDEEDEPSEGNNAQTPRPRFPSKTPQSLTRSARKMIPGLQMSDDLPMGLSQAFAATMAESQTQDPLDIQEQESLDVTADLPSPGLAPVPLLQRLESIELISDSQPSASQTQPLNVNLLSQGQVVPESPHGLGIQGAQYTPSQRQMPFDLTQDHGFVLSPFSGNRFEYTPNLNGLHSTIETVILPHSIEDSPVVQRRGKLQRGRAESRGDGVEGVPQPVTAFEMMQRASKSKKTEHEFDKKKSDARKIVDEAAEESEDEYAGLGGASDDSGDDEENEADRQMIDEDTQVGKGDEAKLAGLYADRERERDEKEVSKLLKDITTGALRRKRGVGDDLDLSDEEDAAARRREARRREFARMRRELLKDEAVGKIAEDKRKEAFLRSIEDREAAEDEGDDSDNFSQAEEADISQSVRQSQSQQVLIAASQEDSEMPSDNTRALAAVSDVKLNRQPPTSRRTNATLNRKPATLADIRASVFFLIEEPDSQAAMVDLGLSDSEDEPEAYVNLDRHLKTAEADENDVEDDGEDLGDFIVDDGRAIGDLQDGLFKKPELPRQERAPYTERRTKQSDVVDRLSLLRQASSSASSTSSTSGSKMAFLSSKTSGGFVGVPTLLRRATTNSSLGSMSGRENVSATGVVTSKTERGNAGDEKEFVRKGNTGRRNAVNYQAERKTLREEKMSARAGVVKATKGKKGHGFLGGLFRGDSWE